jgi:hypothetical protein
MFAPRGDYAATSRQHRLGIRRVATRIVARTTGNLRFYQREYKGQKKQESKLVEDLAGKLFESYEQGHERTTLSRKFR